MFVVLTTGSFYPFALAFRSLGWTSQFTGWCVLLAAGLIGSFLMTRFVNHKPFAAIGFNLHAGMFREAGIGILLGVLMMSGIFAVEYLLGAVEIHLVEASWTGMVWIVVSSMALFGVQSLAEEVLFRGYLFQSLIQGMSFLPAMLAMAALFAAGHAWNPNVSAPAMINIALASVWLSFAYMHTRGLWLPFGLHFAWNFSQTTLFGFHTSGGAFPGYSLMTNVQEGPGWLTGGAFGPEGGVLATLALLVSTAYILKARYLRAPEGIITLDSVEDLLPPANGDGQEEP